MILDPETDVCLVGLGAAGSMAAYALTRAGRRVVALEAGPARVAGQQFVMDELVGVTGRNLWGAPKFNREMPTWRPNIQTPSQASPCYQPMANGVGGSTLAYGAVSHRFHPDDFQVRTNTIARYGAAALPEGTDVVDWPLTYTDLEPYYDACERLIGVSGQAGNLRGTTVPGGNPFEGARQNPFPLPPLRPFGLGELFNEVATKAGYHPYPVPAAVLSEPYDGRQACTYCSYCSTMDCHVGAKGNMLVTVLPSALATGNLEIRTDCRVLQVAVGDGGEVVGVEYDGPAGRRMQPAAVVMLGAFTFENVRLLLLSRSRQFPNGLGNNHGQVGRCYMTRQHPSVYGIFSGRRLNQFTGSNGQAQAIDDFNADNFDHIGLGFVRGGKIWINNQCLPLAESRVVPPWVRRWGQSYKEYVVRDFPSLTEIGILPELLPYESNFLDLDPDVRDAWGAPVIRITLDIGDNERRLMAFVQDRAVELLRAMGANRMWRNTFFDAAMSQHDVGGLRMGKDPYTSVVDDAGRLHDGQNVYVLGGATFPSLPGLNPTLTLQALALRAGVYAAGTTLGQLGLEAATGNQSTTSVIPEAPHVRRYT